MTFLFYLCLLILAVSPAYAEVYRDKQLDNFFSYKFSDEIKSYPTIAHIADPTHDHLHDNGASDTPFNYKSPDDIKPYQAVEHPEDFGCSGYLRIGFLQTEIRSVNTTSANAIGGELACGYRFNAYIKAHLGVFGVLDTGLNRHNDDNIHADFFNRKKDSYLILSEAALTLSLGAFEAHLGRQYFDSPHLDGDDLRMVANLFEAYLVDYHLNDEINLGAGFIRKASGWENGGNNSHFIPTGEGFGGKDNGTWLGWMTYEAEHFSSNAWFYFIPDHLTIFYGDWIYSNQLSSELSYSLAFQYDWGEDIGSAQSGKLDAHTLGAMASIAGYGITLTAAYNKNFGDTGAMSSIGGGPFFTSMEDQTLDAASGDDTQAVLFAMEYAPTNQLSLGVAVAQFRAVDKRDYRAEEINYFLNYNWNDQLTAEVMYAVMDDRNSSEDMNQFRAIITYRY